MLLLLTCLILLQADHVQSSEQQVKTSLTQVATHELEISFDLPAHLVIGRSQIDVPAGDEIQLFLNDLKINTLEINDAPAIEKIDNGVLTLPPSSSARLITINFTKDFASGTNDGLIESTGIALTGHWHPILDMDCKFQLSTRTPSHFEAIAEADTIKTKITGDEKTTSFILAQPLRSLTLIAGPYEVKKEIFGKDKELYSYFFKEDTDLADHYLDKAKAYLTRYEKLLGEYPYKRFSIVENRLPTGFAVPTFTLLGQAVVRLPFIVDTSLGHEILHAWLGNSIRTDLSEGNWSEGLTTYLADQSFANDRGKGNEFRKGQIVKYMSHVTPENALKIGRAHV